MLIRTSSLLHRPGQRSYRPLLEVLESRALPSFITAPSYPAGPSPVAVAVGDFNGAAVADLAVANEAPPYGQHLARQGPWCVVPDRSCGRRDRTRKPRRHRTGNCFPGPPVIVRDSS